ncbi:hypothetical protein G6F23_015568 [Rhizopus arrhizus]|nr:hypothetical protein G6F23_015568 [Rhizopus arrhizus]
MEAAHQHPVQLCGGVAGEIMEGQARALRCLHLGAGVLQHVGERFVGIAAGFAVEVAGQHHRQVGRQGGQTLADQLGTLHPARSDDHPPGAGTAPRGPCAATGCPR